LTCVLDASALLALFHREPGAGRVEEVLDGALISTVNWAEVVQKSVAASVAIAGMREELLGTGANLETFTVQQAETAGRIWMDTQHLGLSLGDRACLALALDKSLPVLTADGAWKRTGLALDIQLIR